MLSEKIALFDLDGTLADFDGQMRRDLAKVLPLGDGGLPDVLGYDTDDPWLENLKRLVRSQPGWWRRLPRFALGWDVLQMTRDLGFVAHVLTKGPASNPLAWGEKLEWCQDHVPGAPVTITQNKALVYGRVLVDDWPPYFLEWLKRRPRGLVVVPAQPWNADYANEDWRVSHIVRYDGTAGAAVAASKALEWAFHRDVTGIE